GPPRMPNPSTAVVRFLCDNRGLLSRLLGRPRSCNSGVDAFQGTVECPVIAHRALIRPLGPPSVVVRKLVVAERAARPRPEPRDRRPGTRSRRGLADAPPPVGARRWGCPRLASPCESAAEADAGSFRADRSLPVVRRSRLPALDPLARAVLRLRPGRRE